MKGTTILMGMIDYLTPCDIRNDSESIMDRKNSKLCQMSHKTRVSWINQQFPLKIVIYDTSPPP